MPSIKSNIKFLQHYATQTKEATTKQRVQTVIDLYSDRKITNFKSAKNVLDNLTASHKKTREKGIKEYDQIVAKYQEAEPLNVRMQKQIEAKTKKVTDTYKISEVKVKDGTKGALGYVELHLDNVKDSNETHGVNLDLMANVVRKVCATQVENMLKKHKTFKIKLGAYTRYQSMTDASSKFDQHVVPKNIERITKHNIMSTIDVLFEALKVKMMEWTQKESGFYISKVFHVFVIFYKTNPVRGSSYIPTPEKYSNAKCGLINIQNDDQFCFRWCMKYHQSLKGKNDMRLSALSKVEDRFCYDGITFPVSYNDIDTFEVNNQVAIFCYHIDEENNVRLDRIGNHVYFPKERIYLLRLDADDKSHYVYIKNIERLLNIHANAFDKDKRFCPMCSCKIHLDKYDKHITECYKLQSEGSLLKLPKPGSVMEFKNFKNMIERPFVVYADTECTLVKTNDPNRIHEHVVNSACYYLSCSFDKSKNVLRTFVGDNCMEDMIRDLFDVSADCIKMMQHNEKMIMTDEDHESFRCAKCCSICNKEFTEKDKRVRDHDHLTGKFRGATHNACNINYFSNRFLPIIFHNLRGYDGHIIVKKAYDIANKIAENKVVNFKAIPNSYEKFMTFSIDSLKFIDSFQFMSTSLENLVNNLFDESDKYKNFNCLKSIFPHHLDLLCQKGYYPYEWMDNNEKFNHVGLPSKNDFYSSLSQKGLDDKEYAHAMNVYDKLSCQSFQDYHMLYLKTDVLLLADVFENFRSTCISYYRLDPANYITSASLAWDAMLLKTSIQLDLISDVELLNMIEQQKRGGLCFVGSKRYVKANNKYIDNYDKTKESNYLIYLDANNLYGWAMSESLPYQDIKWNHDVTLDDVLNTPDDNETGYIVEVDLSFPRELHDKFKEFPPCPESLCPKTEWLSDFQHDLMEKYNIKNTKCSKLVPHLLDHKKYVIHYRNLKFIHSQGVKIDNIHRVISFKQKAWLKPYIDFNTEMRKQAKNDFEKDFFKLMNNSVFGKTMENVKNRMNLHITTSHKNAIKWFSKPNLKNCQMIDGLYLIEMYKQEIVYDKPVYVGTSILDLSKLCMMDFHYNTIHTNFENNYNLIYSDTDSLVYDIKTDDLYDWISKNKTYFDLSESVQPHLKDNANKKVLGKFKDEMNSVPICEFLALNPKVYTINYCVDNKMKNKKTLKGVSKVVVKNEISYNDYKNVLDTNEQVKRYVTSIRSFKHQLFTFRQEKTALTSYYDKMYMSDGLNCVPFGYNPIR